jgi:hypothetical protein
MPDYIERIGKWQVLAIERWWLFQSMWQRYVVAKGVPGA